MIDVVYTSIGPEIGLTVKTSLAISHGENGEKEKMGKMGKMAKMEKWTMWKNGEN